MPAKNKALLDLIDGRKPVSLTPEERRIIEHFRTHGEIPSKLAVRADQRINKMKSEQTELTRKYNEAMAEALDAEERLSLMINLKEDRAVREFTLPPEKKSDRAAVILVASDWHSEERVDPQSVNGLNEFNLSTARVRAKRFFERGLFLTERIKSRVRVDTLVLALLGDLITGYIHEELQEENYLSPPEACIFVQELVRSGLHFLLKEGKFKEIVVPCCYGNHGRTTKKPRASTGWKNSYEWLIYKQLESEFSVDSRVKFQIPQGYHNWVTLFGFPIRFHHGDAIRYDGGVGGPTIPILKKIAKWDQQRKAHLDVFGHLHEHIAHWKFVMNGCLIGYNAYAQKGGFTYSPPQQTLIVIDSKFGRQEVCPIYLDKSAQIHFEERGDDTE